MRSVNLLTTCLFNSLSLSSSFCLSAIILVYFFLIFSIVLIESITFFNRVASQGLTSYDALASSNYASISASSISWNSHYLLFYSSFDGKLAYFNFISLNLISLSSFSAFIFYASSKAIFFFSISYLARIIVCWILTRKSSPMLSEKTFIF